MRVRWSVNRDSCYGGGDLIFILFSLLAFGYILLAATVQYSRYTIHNGIFLASFVPACGLHVICMFLSASMPPTSKYFVYHGALLWSSISTPYYVLDCAASMPSPWVAEWMLSRPMETRHLRLGALGAVDRPSVSAGLN